MENNNKQSNTIAIVGFILSFFISIAGLICSIIGLKKSKELNNGKGFSIAGIIISSIEILFGLVVTILLIVAYYYGDNNVVEDSKNNMNNVTTTTTIIQNSDNNIKYDKNNKTITITLDEQNINNVTQFFLDSRKYPIIKDYILLIGKDKIEIQFIDEELKTYKILFNEDLLGTGKYEGYKELLNLQKYNNLIIFQLSCMCDDDSRLMKAIDLNTKNIVETYCFPNKEGKCQVKKLGKGFDAYDGVLIDYNVNYYSYDSIKSSSIVIEDTKYNTLSELKYYKNDRVEFTYNKNTNEINLDIDSSHYVNLLGERYGHSGMEYFGHQFDLYDKFIIIYLNGATDYGANYFCDYNGDCVSDNYLVPEEKNVLSEIVEVKGNTIKYVTTYFSCDSGVLDNCDLKTLSCDEFKKNGENIIYERTYKTEYVNMNFTKPELINTKKLNETDRWKDYLKNYCAE